MDWIKAVYLKPKDKTELITKIKNNGYTYPQYNKRKNAVVYAVSEYSIKKDCDRLGVEISDVYPAVGKVDEERSDMENKTCMRN